MSTDLKKAKAVLDPYAHLVSSMLKMVAEADDETLDVLADAPSLLTETNCWWATYNAAPIASNLARGERCRRTRAS